MTTRLIALGLIGLALGALALVPAQPIDARCTVRRAVVVAPVVTHDIVTPAAIATFVPIPLAVPSYGVGYDQGFAGLRAELDALKKQNELLTELLKRSQPSLAPLLPPRTSLSPAAHPGLTVMAKVCAACHDSVSAKAKGGGLVLLDGAGLAALSADTKLKTVRALLKGTMPLGGKLSDEDVTQIIDLVSQ